MPNPVGGTTPYWLELGGVGAGWLASAQGGLAVAEVIVKRLGPDNITHKHIAGVKYEDITITCGPVISKAFYDWITGTVARVHTRLDGAVVLVDPNGKDVSRLDFYKALITELGFPALDAASKNTASLTVKFAPVYTQRSKFVGPGGTRPAPEQQWLAANFRLQINDLDCTSVTKVEALVITVRMSQVTSGEVSQPAYLEISDVVATLDEGQADSFYKWHEDFVIKGNNGADKEKSGTLEYLSADLRQVLFTLTLKGLGIRALRPVPVDTTNESVRRVQVQMYCEDMSLTSGVVGLFIF
jgi:hypothetical protein